MTVVCGLKEIRSFPFYFRFTLDQPNVDSERQNLLDRLLDAVKQVRSLCFIERFLNLARDLKSINYFVLIIGHARLALIVFNI